MDYINVFERREQIKQKESLQCEDDLYAYIDRFVKRNPKNVCLKHKSKRGNRLDRIPHSTYSTTSFVLKKRQTINWLNRSFLPMIFVFHCKVQKKIAAASLQLIARMACMAQSQADVYRSVKRNPKNVCFKNRDLKKGVRLDNILHTTYNTTLFVRSKRLNLF